MLVAVHYDAFYLIVAGFDAAYGFRVIRHRLVLDEGEVQDAAALAVKCCQYAALAPPVRRVQVHEPRALYLRLFPFDGYLVHPALDGRRARPECRGQFRYRLFAVLVKPPYFLV